VELLEEGNIPLTDGEESEEEEQERERPRLTGEARRRVAALVEEFDTALFALRMKVADIRSYL
jgi:hypothetical protein